jgi:hypothetical protein
MDHVLWIESVLAECPSSEACLASPLHVRKLCNYKRKLCWSLILLIGIPGLFVFWPAGVVVVFIDAVCWIRVVRTVAESHSSQVFQSICPRCNASVTLWDEDSIICGTCHSLLMRHGLRLYDLNRHRYRKIKDRRLNSRGGSYPPRDSGL